MDERPALIDGGTPEFAERCGLGGRYRYWRDATGRRHLFTAMDAAELADFAEAVVVLACREGTGFRGVAVVRPGDPGEPSAADVAARLAGEAGLVAFVHLLAGSSEARAALAADLTGFRRRLAA